MIYFSKLLNIKIYEIPTDDIKFDMVLHLLLKRFLVVFYILVCCRDIWDKHNVMGVSLESTTTLSNNGLKNLE